LATGKPDIWYPRKAAKYVAETMQLSIEEDCFLTRLMDQYWILQGPLPTDASRLQNLTRYTRAQFNRCEWVLGRYFTLHGGAWHHAELDAELAEAGERKRIAQENGAKGGRPRYQRETPAETRNQPQEKPAGLSNPKPRNNPAGFPAGKLGGNPDPNPEESSLPLPLPEEEKENAPASPGARADFEKKDLWEDLVAEFRLVPVTDRELKQYRAVVHALHAKCARKGDIPTWAKLYRKEWPNVKCTPWALVKWWDYFAPKQPKAETPAEREVREARARELEEWMAMPQEEREAVAKAFVEDAMARMAR
jgi:uncharacterized protein YdaU (DUF1376 family)